MPTNNLYFKDRMSIGIRTTAAVIGLILVQACTGATSVEIGTAGDPNLGPTYYLPTTVIPLTIEIAKEPGRITVAALEPVYVPDLAAGEFRLNSIYSPMYATDLGLTTTASGLLTSIDYTSDGRLDEALVNLAKSAGTILRPEADVQKNIVFESLIDLAALVEGGEKLEQRSELAKLNAKIEQTLRSVLKGHASGFLKEAKNAPGPLVTLSVRRLALPTHMGNETARCHIGFCYRRAIPYVVSASFFDGNIAETIVEVPNGAPIRAAALNRGALAKWTNTVVLSNGMLTKYRYVTDASMMEKLALLPFELVGGAVAGLTQRGKLWDAASTRLDSETKYREKLAKLEDNPQSESRVRWRLFEFSAGNMDQGLDMGQGLNQHQSPKNHPVTRKPGAPNQINGPSGPSTSGSPGLGG